MMGVHADLSVSRLEGIEGNEKKEYIKDYIEDLIFNGIPAEGGLTPRIGANFGGYATKYFARRFALNFQLDYLQTGWNERIKAVGETSTGEAFEHEYSFNAKLDYVTLSPGLKYFNDYGVNLTLSLFLTYNVLDKIKYENNYRFESRAGLEEISEKQDYFFHEYYGVNRQIFVAGGWFGMGYEYDRYEVEGTIKITSPLLADDSVKMNFLIFGLGLKYKLNRLNNED